MDFPKFTELFRIARDEVLARNSRLSVESVERDGSDANVLLAAAAAAADDVVGQLIDVSAGLYLDSAEGTNLDRLVFDRYGLVRKPAAPAFGSVQFRTTALNPFAFVIPINTLVQTADGTQYLTTVSTTFNAGITGPVTVAVRSILAGSSQQAKIGTITSIVSAISGSPADLRVNNTVATAGADDEEQDGPLRDRARRFFTTARRGTIAALEAGALAVPGVRRATAFEVLDALGRPARFVQLIITDAFTELLVGSTPIPPGYEAQSQVLAQEVFNSLSDVRAAGIYVQVIVGQVILQPIQLQLTFTAGVSVDQVANNARAAIVNQINALAPGQGILIVDLQTALKNVPGLVITGGEVVSPAGNVIAKPLQVMRTTLALVSAVSLSVGFPIISSLNPDAAIVAAS